jgi:hypothetical protein
MSGKSYRVGVGKGVPRREKKKGPSLTHATAGAPKIPDYNVHKWVIACGGYVREGSRKNR